jgi:hypothetical protein
MGIKAIIFTDPECATVCEDAVASMKDYIESGEMEVMEIGEALEKGFELGEPEGVPFIGYVSERTKKCLSKAMFHDEGGNIVVQRYVTEVEGEPKKLSQEVSHIVPQTGEETIETDEGRAEEH